MSVRAVFGVPTFNGENHVQEALASILGQQHSDFRVVVVDDASTDSTVRLVREIARSDRRVTVLTNPIRLGMQANWVRAFDEAGRASPDAPFFAWGSDHDLWDPCWLEAMVSALEMNPRAVLAYPLTERFTPAGGLLRTPRRFDTCGVRDPRLRIREAARRMPAGDMIYGLFRRDALEVAGIFPAVLLPDRLVLARLTQQGEFVQVDRVLWRRRMTTPSTASAQRRTLFADELPAIARLPWWLGHTAALVNPLGVRTAAAYGTRALGVATRSRAGALLSQGRHRLGMRQRARDLKRDVT